MAGRFKGDCCLLLQGGKTGPSYLHDEVAVSFCGGRFRVALLSLLGSKMLSWRAPVSMFAVWSKRLAKLALDGDYYIILVVFPCYIFSHALISI
jgi:hypothetical protein